MTIPGRHKHESTKAKSFIVSESYMCSLEPLVEIYYNIHAKSFYEVVQKSMKTAKGFCIIKNTSVRNTVTFTSIGDIPWNLPLPIMM